MKKITSIILSVMILFSTVITVSARQSGRTFEDVSENHYAYDAVEYFYRENVIKGVGNNKYDPEGFITREQFAKMISIIYGKENYQPEEQTFSDVTKNMWSYTYIESVKEYLTGYYPEGGEAFFNPTAKATREDIAYALVKIGGLQKYEDMSVLENYEDNLQISVNLRSYIAAAVSAGLMQGYENKLRPQDGCTRAEVAALLFRAIKKPVDVNGTTTSSEEDPEAQHNKNKNKIKTDDIISISGYTEDNIEGEITLEWSEDKKSAKFDTKLVCRNGAFEYVKCEIKLSEIISVGKNSITGYFDVSMDGKIRHDNIEGEITVDDGIIKLNTCEYDYNLVAEIDYDDKDDDMDDDKKQDEKKEDNDDKIKPAPEENIISANNIVEFKIINTEGENIFVDDPDRLSGRAQMIFGEDGIKDSKLIADITVDGKDEYHLESYYIDRYDMSSESVLLELNYKVYKNDKLIINQGGYRVYVHKGDDEMTLNGRLHFVGMDIVWATGKLPAEPKDQPWEVWADASVIAYRVNDGDENAGYINYVYKTDKKISKLESDFVLDGKKYSVELIKEISKTEDQLSGVFKIICDGKVLAEKVNGTISSYKSKPGSEATFEFEGNFPEINLTVIEITQ